MKLFHSKVTLIAVSAAFLAANAAHASSKKNDDWDIAALLGNGSTFTLGMPASQDPGKNLDKEIVIGPMTNVLYFQNGKQIQSLQDPDGGSGKSLCKVYVKNNTGRTDVLTQTPLTISDVPFEDPAHVKWEDFDLDASQQVDKSGNPNQILVYKVSCTAPMVKNGRSNLTLKDLEKAFGKFASVNVFGNLNPNPAAPANPAPPSDNAPVDSGKPSTPEGGNPPSDQSNPAPNPGDVAPVSPAPGAASGSNAGAAF